MHTIHFHFHFFCFVFNDHTSTRTKRPKTALFRLSRAGFGPFYLQRRNSHYADHFTRQDTLGHPVLLKYQNL